MAMLRKDEVANGLHVERGTPQKDDHPVGFREPPCYLVAAHPHVRNGTWSAEHTPVKRLFQT
jgi:hypothetical protein